MPTNPRMEHPPVRGSGEVYWCPNCKTLWGDFNVQSKTGRKVCIRCGFYLTVNGK